MENLPLAINLTFVGITVVFIALILLSLIIYYSTKLLSLKKSGNTKNDNLSDEASILEIDEEEEVKPVLPACVKSEDELIAVIMAAVQASIIPEPQCRLEIKSFRRIGQTSPVWNKAGRLDRITNKL